MTSARSTAINIVSLLFGRLGYRITTALASILIARAVSHEAYGLFATALAWSSATLAFNDLGLSAYMLKTASKKDPQFPLYFGNTLLLQSILSFVICIALSSLGAILFSPEIGALFAIVSFGQLIYEFRKTFRAVFRSHHSLHLVSATEFISGALFLISIIALSGLRVSPSTLLLYCALAGTCSQLLNVGILCAGAIRLEMPKIRATLLPRMIINARHFFIYNIFLLLYFQIDQILISVIQSPAAVAVYSAPAQLIMMLLFIPFTVFQATTPLMFQWFEEAKEKYYTLLNIQIRYFFAIATPISILIFILPDTILHLVYGEKFFDSTLGYSAENILKIFAIFLTLRFISIALINALLTSDKAGHRMKFQIIVVICNILLDLILIPLYGALGAAIATLCVEIGTLIALFIIHKSLGSLKNNTLSTSCLRVVFAALIMSICIVLLRPLLPVIVLVVISIIVYISTLLLVGFCTSSDKKLLKAIRKPSV